MAFTDFPEQKQVVQLLQRSLERHRLGHAYLFTGGSLDELEGVARTLAKVLNCQSPKRRAADSPAIDCCDECVSCRKISNLNHPDVQWVRPEMKSRVIGVDQVRDLMSTVQLTPTEATHKVGILVAADRLNEKAANAFLKTLEEPPKRSVLILLTTDPERLLETILSRCLRLNFAGDRTGRLDPRHAPWLMEFIASAAGEQKTLLDRYRLLGGLMARLTELKEIIEKDLEARSPLEQHPDAEADLRDKWEKELLAAQEAEYRRQRGELLGALQLWMREVWVYTLGFQSDLSAVPELAADAKKTAARLTPDAAAENLRILEQLQRWLFTNVQEALALEVGLLRLKL